MAMPNRQSGFSILEPLLFLLAAAFVGLAGWYVYKTNQLASDTLDNLADISTAKPANATRVAAAGDIACDPNDKHFSGSDSSYCQMERTYTLLSALKPDAVLALGDLQYENGELDKFNASFDKNWGKLKAKTYPAPGNHEYVTPGAAGYFGYFGERAGDPAKGYYSFNVGSWHMIALNSNCSDIGSCAVGSAQYQWLEQDLKTSPKACTLAFWHHPRFTSGRYSESTDTTGRMGAIWELLQNYQADVVLSGHDHLYERFAPQNSSASSNPAGIRQFTVGTGGKVLYKKGSSKPNSEVLIDDQFGVLVLDLYAKAYKWQFVSTDNKVLDGGHQQCVG
jgi:3',5'-cyclic AMP phosphodiesterase CpdA